MSSTYLTLCQQARRECGVSGTGPSSVSGQTGMLQKIVEWVADADEYICSKWLDWGFLHTEHSVNTIAGTKDYSAPSDLGMWDAHSFYLDRTSSTFKNLVPMDYWYWRDALRNGLKTNVEPTYIVIKPDLDIILEGPPDAIYSLTADYYKTTTRLSGNTDTSPIPSRFDRLIIAKVKWYYGYHEDAPEILTEGKEEFVDLMNRLESIYRPGQQGRTSDIHNDDMVITVE